MMIKTSFEAAAHILSRSKSTKGYTFQGLASFGFPHELVTTALRQTDVADNDVKWGALQKIERSLRGLNRGNFVPALRKQPCKDATRVGMIVDDYHAQSSRGFALRLAALAECRSRRIYCVQSDPE